MEWVIDTNVFVIANEGTNPANWECITFLCDAIRSGWLVLDNEGDIQAEYKKRIPASSSSGAWLRNAMSKNRVMWYSSKVSPGIRHGLEALKFDKSDFKWVGAAICTGDNPHVIVAAADSDWSTEVRQWLRDHCDTRVTGPTPEDLNEVAAGQQ